MAEKKKRGSNYTAAEKNILLGLVQKHLNVIENKATNGQIILKKRKAWDVVCQQYNAVAVSGARSWQQLRHLYENIKQRSRKNVARANHRQFYDSDITKEIEKKASLDKKEINHTGGGPYKSSLTAQDNQILATVAPQIQPLSNIYDSSTVYFGDVSKGQNNKESASELVVIENNNTDEPTANIHIEIIDEPCTSTFNKADNQEITIPSIIQDCVNTSTSHSTEQVKPKRKAFNVKDQYFKTKLRCAKLEYRNLINRRKMDLNIYKLELEILKLKLQKLKK